MHSYGDWPDERFNEVDDAGYYIGRWLRTWVRLPVTQIKEKFGTVRVYCGFGWSTLYSIWRPSHCWVSPYWPYKLDLWLSYDTPFLKWLNFIVVPIQQRAYAWRYKKAVQKWPHLYNEIVSCADHGELFEGVVPGYKHSDFWQEVDPHHDRP